MRRPLNSFLVLICIVGFAAVPGFPQSTQPPAQQPAPAQQAAGEIIRVEDGRLTLKVANRDIESVVGLIARTTRVPLVDIGGALGKRNVDLDFQNVPLDEALRMILKDYDTFFLYGGDGGVSAALRQVWIYAKGEGHSFDPIPREACAGTDRELRDMVHASDPEVKARALPALIERVVAQLLTSADEQERSLALSYAMDNNMELPAETLRNLALADSSAATRVMALDALTGADPKIAQQVFQKALEDPDAQVRAKAKEIVDQLTPLPAREIR